MADRSPYLRSHNCSKEISTEYPSITERAGYDQFNLACKRIQAARDPEHCDIMEDSFTKFAVDKYGEAGTASKRKRAEDADGGVEDVFNELD